MKPSGGDSNTEIPNPDLMMRLDPHGTGEFNRTALAEVPEGKMKERLKEDMKKRRGFEKQRRKEEEKERERDKKRRHENTIDEGMGLVFCVVPQVVGIFFQVD